MCHVLSGADLLFNCGIVLYLTLLVMYTQCQRLHETIVNARKSMKSRGSSLGTRSSSIFDDDVNIVVGTNPLNASSASTRGTTSAGLVKEAELELAAAKGSKNEGKKEGRSHGHGRSQSMAAAGRSKRLGRLGRARASLKNSSPSVIDGTLPHGWKSMKSTDGRSYFVRPDGTTTWDLP